MQTVYLLHGLYAIFHMVFSLLEAIVDEITAHYKHVFIHIPETQYF